MYLRIGDIVQPTTMVLLTR